MQLRKINEKKLDQFLKQDPFAVEVVRITPEYYQGVEVGKVGKYIFTGTGALFLGILILLTITEPVAAFFLPFALLFLIIFLLFAWPDALLYPYILQSIITDGVEIVKWFAVYGFVFIRRYPVEGLDYIERRRGYTRESEEVSHQLVLVYYRDQYGKRREEILWEEGNQSENVIETIARKLEKHGLNVKEPVFV